MKYSTPPIISKRQSHLNFLDGMRGLAALYVVIYHLIGLSTGLLPPARRFVVSWAIYGHFAVDIFIVLSGYCLMLPVIRSEDQKLREGTLNFFLRRARRILPPYYATLALAIVLESIQLHGLKPHFVSPLVSAGDFFSHFFLVHNLTIWHYSINSPLWSVATEWQIYFLFPLLLLPVWRRFGIVPSVICGFCVGLIPHFLLATGHNFDVAAPWYLGLFSLGMLGATIKPTATGKADFIKTILTSRLLPLVVFVIICLVIWFGSANIIALDALVGLMTVSLIVLLVQQSVAMRCPSVFLQTCMGLLESKPLVFLGTISYSLYLTHMLAMLKVYPVMQMMHLSNLNELIFRFFICIPWTVLFAYFFFLAIERPSLNRKKHESMKELAREAILEPAP